MYLKLLYEIRDPEAECERLQNRVHAMYIDKLDGRIDRSFYAQMSEQWRVEQEKLMQEITLHQAADQCYLDEGVRLLELAPGGLEPDRELQLKRILGGMLVQQPDLGQINDAELRTVTKRVPSPEEMHNMRFAWKVCKHVKSNAIVFARDGATLGVGAGQMSRVDSVKLAVMKAQSPLQGSVVASDAFFPFPDGVEEAAKAGATAVIQPGGSVRDNDVIAAADRLGLAMVFTGMRHFLH